MNTPHDTAGLAGPADYDEAAAVAYVGRLVDLEQAGERNDVRIGPYSLFTMIGAMQLVLRRPDLPGGIRRVLTGLVEQWRKPFDGTAGEPLINMGYDPSFDGDGRPNCAGTFEAWLQAKYPDPVGRACIEASENDLRDAWFAGRASLTSEQGRQ